MTGVSTIKLYWLLLPLSAAFQAWLVIRSVRREEGACDRAALLRRLRLCAPSKRWPIAAWDAVFLPAAQGLRRLIEVNRTLPRGSRIRVVSISVGWSPGQPGFDEIEGAAQVDPNITPDRFWTLVRKTGRWMQYKDEPFGPMIDPPALIATLRQRT